MSSTPPQGQSPSEQQSKKNATIFFFQPSKNVKAFAKKYRTEIAASSSSVLSTFTAFPLDFTKSRMQSYENGFLHTVKDAYKAEGLRAFWRGAMPPLLSVTAVRTISFSIYQKAKYAIDHAIFKTTGHSPLVIANAPGSYPDAYTVTCFGLAGATSGAIVTLFSCPFELTKLNEQLAGKVAREARANPGSNPSMMIDLKAGAWHTARRLVREHGLRGLYMGFNLHVARDTIGTAIYFVTYESTKQLMANARGKSPTSPYAVAAAGGLCGIVSWACIYPVDVAKTVYQKQLLAARPGESAPKPVITFFQKHAYRGLGVSVLRSMIINMIFFSNFEFVKKRINALELD